MDRAVEDADDAARADAATTPRDDAGAIPGLGDRAHLSVLHPGRDSARGRAALAVCLNATRAVDARRRRASAERAKCRLRVRTTRSTTCARSGKA